VYIPQVCWFLYRAYELEADLVTSIALFIFGLFHWTFLEYTLHRFLFHGEDYWLPDIKGVIAFHWMFHGIHHTFPQEKLRLVMPIAPGLAILNLFITLPLFLALSPEKAFVVTAGTYIGYICYDMMHYFFHHSSPKSGYVREMKQIHMAHHYRDGKVAFGVSNKFWDVVFRT
jgi:4-hydroxysphinganine ceramide fatty acyl 2-hydroxylase